MVGVSLEDSRREVCQYRDSEHVDDVDICCPNSRCKRTQHAQCLLREQSHHHKDAHAEKRVIPESAVDELSFSAYVGGHARNRPVQQVRPNTDRQQHDERRDGLAGPRQHPRGKRRPGIDEQYAADEGRLGYRELEKPSE